MICSNCRNKKIRCDGVKPKCGSCTGSRKYVQCDYNGIRPTVPNILPLRKGEACIPCRRKKKKCSGRRPFCETCAVAGHGDQCHYEHEARPNLTASLLEHTQELEARLQMYEGPSAPVTPFGFGAISYASSPSSSSSSANSSSFDPGPSGSRAPCFTNPPSTSSMECLDYYAISNLEGDSSGQIPPFTSATCPSMDSPHPMLQPGPPADRLLCFRMMFLAHGAHLGLCLSEEKLNALRLGDLSGAVLQPAMVHTAHVWGHLFWQLKHSISLPEEEMYLCKLAVDSLKHLPQSSPDIITWLGAHGLMGLYFFRRGDICRGREFILKASNIVLESNLHITLPLSEATNAFHLGAAVDESEERMSTLCQLLYVEKVSELMLKLPLQFNNQLDDEFQAAFTSTRPSASGNSLAILRTGSVSLLRETRQLLSGWDDWGSGQPNCSPWYNRYWSLIERLHKNLCSISQVHLRSTFDQQDHDTQLVLKFCVLVTSTALGDLHKHFASTNSESRRQCVDSAVEIVSVTSTLGDEDFDFLDPILSSCWSSTAKTLVQEGNNTLYASSIPVMLDVLRRAENTIRRATPSVSNM
ncbi:hypothetical protein HYDPIDRAFT_40278 [Hydnomerulius pinastri MD-312]|uniref:Zn(2)-C6 fungal-type domain-containing protein n=1 Tax=Hydnomerulius pinastri MD-312 TaxID=994086 RepID=A0A0C9WFW0_9AGAM|nr:hypothetical protein HYDPIDRAFT_40278 [Hydnomerulius pinastri MD-312]